VGTGTHFSLWQIENLSAIAVILSVIAGERGLAAILKI
jgi:hypothetical protein